MTQEEKELLLKDLCARLPYSTLCYCKWTKDAPNGTSGCVQEVSTYLLEELMIIGDQNYKCQICEIKPYLRPMSSMIEEEFKDLKNYSGLIYDQLELQEFFNNSKCLEFYLTEIPSYIVILVFDWLNAHHFDYRGLIERGLALEAKEGMYNIIH